MAIFSIMLVVLISAFSRFVQQQTRHTAEQELQEDLRVVLEIFNREARTAYGNTYQRTLLAGNQAVSFINQSGNCVVYGLSDQGTILRGEVETCDLPDYLIEDDFFAPLTAESSKVKIKAFSVQFLRAQVDGQNKLTEQGILSLALNATVEGRDDPIRIQSTVVSRQVVPFLP